LPKRRLASFCFYSAATRLQLPLPSNQKYSPTTKKINVMKSMSYSYKFLCCILLLLSTNALKAVEGFSLIPAGAFTMGNSVAEDADIKDAPPHTVILDSFYMGKYEVTKQEWDGVRTWALNNGYTDLVTGEDSDRAINLPVHTISWYQAVKWCNARSEKEGLIPIYYTNNGQTEIYRTGDVDISNAQVKWSANGYRLPTEAEWEKASRGGLSGKRFPWGDMISHPQANYYAIEGYSYDLSGFRNDFHPSYKFRLRAATAPVATFNENGYGLYCMAGNVDEWCWDWYGIYDTKIQTRPQGVTSGKYRVLRGGSWNSMAFSCRSAYRVYNLPTDSGSGTGFRVVRGAAANEGNTSPTISDIPAQKIDKGSSTGALIFTVEDAQTSPSSLLLSASSSNTVVVPNSNIVIGGDGVNRTVTVTPVSSQTGTATITVTVSDGLLSRSDTFILTVIGNTPPAISDIAARSINQGSSTGALAFTINDAETVASALSLSASSSNAALIPKSNIIFGGRGKNRTVTVIPVSSKTGTAAITVTVSDGLLSSACSFVLTVEANRITSSLSKVVIAKGKPISPYTVRTNFSAKNFSATNLPPGLRLQTNGVISGNPTKAGTYNVTITAQKNQGGKVVQSVKANKIFEVK
jgi:formylglycine-generating enzyme required for sulfatase activity